MGVIPGAEIEVVRIAPLGDPVEYKIKGYRLSLRRNEAAHVVVESLPCTDSPEQRDGECRAAAPLHRPGWLNGLLNRNGHGR